jgi:hypothetical protein
MRHQALSMTPIWHRTEVRFASFLSSGFTAMAVMNPPEKKLEKYTSVHHCTLLKSQMA